MFSSGLLILTRPLKVLQGQIPSLLKQASQVVSDTLYVHLQPLKGDNTAFRILPVPVTSDVKTVVKDIYSIGSTVCRRLDIRVLLNHVTNNDIPIAPYALKKGYNVVMVDTGSFNKSEFLTQVKECFPGETDYNFVILEHLENGPQFENTVDSSILKTYPDVVLGGTFDRPHVGHKILLSEGCIVAEKRLTVGVSEGKMNDKKVLSELIQPLQLRTEVVTDFIKDVKPSIKPDVVTIVDAFGPTITDPDFQCIILSEETRKGGQMVNEEREKRGMKRLDEVVIDLVVDDEHADDEDEKVSSSSLRRRTLGTLIQPPKYRLNVPETPYRIGLTGGIASGKSAICKRLESLGAGIVNCDNLGHEAYKPGMSAFLKVKDEFGAEIVGSDGNIDRRKLGSIVFTDKNQLKKLNGIVWPEIMKLAEQEIEKFAKEGKKVVVLDAAVLLEAGWNNYVHEVWSTFVPRPEAVKRMKERNNLSEEEAVKRLDSQLSNVERLSHANVALCTLWEYEYTQKQCEKAWGLLQDRIRNFHISKKSNI